jgi:hypothetical protein
MKHLKSYRLFEFVETSRNTPILYKDDNIEVKVTKTYDATRKQNLGTNWCSSSKGGFYAHNKTANMYRINFKDGYKLRLTWDYIHQGSSELGSYSGGTHWGQGGVVNGENQWYDVLRPRNNDDPFFIDWKSDKEREIVKRIKSLPAEAVNAIKDYQNKSSIEKTANLINLYSEIRKIKVLDVSFVKDELYGYVMEILVKYNGSEYILRLTDELYLLNSGDIKKFSKDFKNKYFRYGKELPQYLYDKSRELLKRNKKNEIPKKV